MATTPSKNSVDEINKTIGKARFYRYLPEHMLSRVLGRLANKKGGWLKERAINWFVRHYDVDVNCMEKSHLTGFATFNEFFTRSLKASARPLSTNPTAIVSPVDGTVYAAGTLNAKTILKAKGAGFNTQALLGGDAKLAALFADGEFIAQYLSPRDYHRVHMPLTGVLQKMIYIPGRLFSVKPKVIAKVSNVFSRNERVVCVFETKLGPMAVILVGAKIVGSIATTWHGQVVGEEPCQPCRWSYMSGEVTLMRGQELGRFMLGSTVIVLFSKRVLQWSAHVKPGQHCLMGSQIAVNLDANDLSEVPRLEEE